jgi:hypothetical protein
MLLQFTAVRKYAVTSRAAVRVKVAAVYMFSSLVSVKSGIFDDDELWTSVLDPVDTIPTLPTASLDVSAELWGVFEKRTCI